MVSHLQFTDDTLLMIEWSEVNMKATKLLLKNYEKSYVYIINVGDKAMGRWRVNWVVVWGYYRYHIWC